MTGKSSSLSLIVAQDSLDNRYERAPPTGVIQVIRDRGAEYVATHYVATYCVAT